MINWTYTYAKAFFKCNLKALCVIAPPQKKLFFRLKYFALSFSKPTSQIANLQKIDPFVRLANIHPFYRQRPMLSPVPRSYACTSIYLSLSHFVYLSVCLSYEWVCKLTLHSSSCLFCLFVCLFQSPKLPIIL